MGILLKLEYVALLALSVCLFSLLSFAWSWYLVLFLVPDVGMLGYAVSARVGAWTYNLLHSLALGIGLYLGGQFLSMPLSELAGVILIGHIAFDRILGYGFKYEDSFKHTHSGDL